jgi:hypothetical protein
MKSMTRLRMTSAPDLLLLPVYALIAGAMLAPVKSYAQGDQVLVFLCTTPGWPNARETLTLDLAKKTYVQDDIGGDGRPVPQTSGTITQITDTQITMVQTFTSSGITNTNTRVLNRYTGEMDQTTTVTGNCTYGCAPGHIAWTCVKQQKQF